MEFTVFKPTADEAELRRIAYKAIRKNVSFTFVADHSLRLKATGLIAAIRDYRMATQSSLLDSKNMIEGLAYEMLSHGSAQLTAEYKLRQILRTAED